MSGVGEVGQRVIHTNDRREPKIIGVLVESLPDNKARVWWPQSSAGGETLVHHRNYLAAVDAALSSLRSADAKGGKSDG
jgi:hypothetical protein